jgi:hypothetical protein
MPASRITPSDFSQIIDSIEYQKAYLFRIKLPDLTIRASKPVWIMTSLSSGAGVMVMVETKYKQNDAFDYCTSATSFPVMNTEVQTVNFYNSEFKFGKKNTFSEWNATFRLDLNNKAASNNYSVSTQNGQSTSAALAPCTSYDYFYAWQSTIYDTGRRTSNLPVKYKHSIDLILLNEKGEETRMFTLEGAFPTQISGGNLDYANDSILTYTVNFAFDRFQGLGLPTGK